MGAARALASSVVVLLAVSAPGCLMPELVIGDDDGSGGGGSDEVGGSNSGGGGSDDNTGGENTGSADSGGQSSGGGGEENGGSGGDGSGGATSGGGSDGSGGNGSGAASSGGGGGFVCDPPTLPESTGLTTVNQKLPDPFTFLDGTPVTTREEWDCRRQEILAMADKYLYGPVPPAPDVVSGSVSGGAVSITATVGSTVETFAATIGSGDGDVIALKLSGGIFPADSKPLTFGVGFEDKIRNLFGLSSLNTNVAHGWMIDRVMDVLEQNPSSGYDPSKVMVSGCSGCGKGAFVTGVFSRAPLVIIVESGGGGASSLRQTEWFRHGEGQEIYECVSGTETMPPQGIDNLEPDGSCGPWVSDASDWLRTDPSKVYQLPFDQHLLLATIAPRHLLHFTNNHGENMWCHLGGTSEALSAWAAKPVFEALGVPERMGFYQYDASHCSSPDEADELAEQFFLRAFAGDTNADTDVLSIMVNGVQQPVADWEDMWVDWDMTTVLE